MWLISLLNLQQGALLSKIKFSEDPISIQARYEGGSES